MDSWGTDIQPDTLKRACHACGRAEYLDNLALCTQCRHEFDDDMAAWQLEERNDDDMEARARYYSR